MKSDPVLVVLAAGIGSRYGGTKQLDGVGPKGETLMEYSLFDAKRAGFKTVLFIIKKEIGEIFKNRILEKYNSQVNISYLFQELEDLPLGFSCPADRVKPWGTGQAILATRNQITGPFAVINADDFYGRDAFQVMYNYLKSKNVKNTTFCLLAYRLVNTLSKNGSVNRGVCEIKNGLLTSLKEVHSIRYYQGKLTHDEQDLNGEVTINSRVSMNFWGFTPVIFELLEEEFRKFLQKNRCDSESEFYITTAIDAAQASDIARVEVLNTDGSWMGVTYPEDKKLVVTGISDAIERGEYPNSL